jgi:hypothetical protein
MPKDAWIYPRRDDKNVIISGKSLEAMSNVPNGNWEIVRSYDQFVAMIESRGIPQIVSFDHDLHPEHMDHYFDVTSKTGKIHYDELKIKTGKHCAEFLVDKLKNLGDDVNIKTFVHSANRWGAEQIRKTLTSLIND